jgi:hypothetical protein
MMMMMMMIAYVNLSAIDVTSVFISYFRVSPSFSFGIDTD